MRSPLLPLSLTLLLIAVSNVLRADDFLLDSGGRLQGTWRNPDKLAADDYDLETPLGVHLRLAADRVREVVRASPQFAEYERLAPTFRDSADDQWKLAEWCRTHDLKPERTAALQRTITHEPNHLLARRALGYLYIDGEWITPSAVREKEGYVYYRGRWRTTQEVEIVEAKAKRALAEKEWAAKLLRWRADLENPQRASAAQQSIVGIRDPFAITPLTQLWQREPLRSMKLVYVDVLANINAADSCAAIAATSLNDPDDEVFYECLDRLLKLKPERFSQPYVEALRGQHNGRINRAAKALALIKDRTAVSPLIDALITQHTILIPGKGIAPPGGYAASFSKDGNSSFVQNDNPKLQLVRAHNDDVLTALTKLTGANFGYDQKAWRAWFAQEATAGDATARVPRRE